MDCKRDAVKPSRDVIWRPLWLKKSDLKKKRVGTLGLGENSLEPEKVF